MNVLWVDMQQNWQTLEKKKPLDSDDVLTHQSDAAQFIIINVTALPCVLFLFLKNSVYLFIFSIT